MTSSGGLATPDAEASDATAVSGRPCVALAEVLRSLRERPDSSPDETLCARLGLLPLLSLGPQPRASRHALATYLTALGTNRRLRESMSSAGRAFGAAGIPAIVYKGQDYLDRLYGDLGGREMGDVDVLVRESDLEAAEQALTAAGFVPGVACRTAPHERAWTSQTGTVDLHHALLQPGRMRVDHDALFTRSLPCSAAPGFRVLEPTDALLVHSIGHTVYGLCVPPSWYVEFQWLLARADASAALRRASDYGALSAWYCSVHALAQCWPSRSGGPRGRCPAGPAAPGGPEPAGRIRARPPRAAAAEPARAARHQASADRPAVGRRADRAAMVSLGAHFTPRAARSREPGETASRRHGGRPRRSRRSPAPPCEDSHARAS